MDNLLNLTLVAHNAARNHHRFYSLTLGRNLFDDWTVSIHYGRIGQAGREVRFASPDPAAMASVIGKRLERRLSAPGRIGCRYRLAELSAAPSIDAHYWLSSESIHAFSQ